MERWLIYALIAPAFWASVNLIDKRVLGRLSNLGPFLYTIFAEIITFPIILVVILFTGAKIPTEYGLVYTVLIGILTPVASFMYFLAIRKSDPVTIAILFQTIPAFSLFFGVYIFREQLTSNQYFGALLLIVGSIIAILIVPKQQVDKGKLLYKDRASGILLMLFSALLFSLGYVFQKLGSKYLSSVDILVWSNMTSFCLAVTILVVMILFLKPKIQGSAFSTLPVWATATLSVIVNLLGTFAIIQANRTGPLALVAAAAATQPIFVMLFSAVTGGNNGKTVFSYGVIRLAAIAMIIVGVYLISLHL